jgi:hypothetical protein
LSDAPSISPPPFTRSAMLVRSEGPFTSRISCPLRSLLPRRPNDGDVCPAEAEIEQALVVEAH